MVWVKLGSVGENLIGKLVQVLDLPGEPGHSLRIVHDVPGDDLEVARLVLNDLQSSLNVANFGVNLIVGGENLEQRETLRQTLLPPQ